MNMERHPSCDNAFSNRCLNKKYRREFMNALIDLKATNSASEEQEAERLAGLNRKSLEGPGVTDAITGEAFSSTAKCLVGPVRIADDFPSIRAGLRRLQRERDCITRTKDLTADETAKDNLNGHISVQFSLSSK